MVFYQYMGQKTYECPANHGDGGVGYCETDSAHPANNVFMLMLRNGGG